jgi:hypothetical protein
VITIRVESVDLGLRFALIVDDFGQHRACGQHSCGLTIYEILTYVGETLHGVIRFPECLF